MKSELRFLGVDDSPFTREDKEVLVVCTLFRGNKSIDGVLSFSAVRDGFDGSEKLIKAVKSSRYFLNAVFIDGVSFGGFNVLDLQKISRELRLPVISIVRRKPDLKALRNALMHVPDFRKHWILVKKLPEVNVLELPVGRAYYQCVGITPEKAGVLIKVAILRGKFPECVRIAHLIGAGIIKGKSRGRA